MAKQTKTTKELESEIRSLKRRLGVAQKNVAALSGDLQTSRSHHRALCEDVQDARELLRMAQECDRESNAERLIDTVLELI